MEGKTVGIRQDMSLHGLEDYTLLVRHIMVKHWRSFTVQKIVKNRVAYGEV